MFKCYRRGDFEGHYATKMRGGAVNLICINKLHQMPVALIQNGVMRNKSC